MKKVLQFIKQNTIGFIAGLVIAGSIGVYAVSVASSDVTYDNTNSGSTATTVEGAIDDLYSKIENQPMGLPIEVWAFHMRGASLNSSGAINIDVWSEFEYLNYDYNTTSGYNMTAKKAHYGYCKQGTNPWIYYEADVNDPICPGGSDARDNGLVILVMGDLDNAPTLPQKQIEFTLAAMESGASDTTNRSIIHFDSTWFKNNVAKVEIKGSSSVGLTYGLTSNGIPIDNDVWGKNIASVTPTSTTNYTEVDFSNTFTGADLNSFKYVTMQLGSGSTWMYDVRVRLTLK